jgi:serine/threonine-protein kinase
MLNTDMGACELFIGELRRCGLIDRGPLDRAIEEFGRRTPHADPNQLAEYLVKQNLLTQFQADRILHGKAAGLILGPYVLLDVVGQGSMGQVHRALSKTDNQLHAVKVLPRRSMWNVRLARRQVRMFAQVNHPAVVPFVDVGTSGGLHYLVWPFIDGESLDKLVQREGKLSARRVAELGGQLASGLAMAHNHGLFHGLLKPSNVMLCRDQQARILDFGIGSLLAENEGESLVDTMSTANALTSGLDCTSPESIMEPTNRTLAGDQYSLGCVLYFCLTGQYPFSEGSAVEKMMAHQFKQPKPIKELAPDTPDEIIAVIDRLMQKKPEDRFVGVDEAVEAFGKLNMPPESRLTGQVLSPAPRPHAQPAPGFAAPGYEIARPAPAPLEPPAAPTLGVSAGATPTLPDRRTLFRAPAVSAAPVAPMAPPQASPNRPAASAHVMAQLRPTHLETPVIPPSVQPAPVEGSAAQPMGPLGFLMLGILVAVGGFLAMVHFLK